ncbi:Oxysterol-binding protein [Xylariaceae sp. FL0804]|nr:Oxysterol-binding protein [Xylariaceae sp. FL0804]
MALALSPAHCEDRHDGRQQQQQQQQKSAWFQFMKSLATYRGDLVSLPAPPFLLAPVSMVEYSAYWAEHPRLFVAPAREEDPARRALLVLQWFLSTLREQHASRDESGRRRKMKPLNPILGEFFLGRWEDDEDDVGTTRLVSEQVSHHPPATAYRIWNERNGVQLEGHVAPRAHFTSTVNIERKGYSLYHLDRFDETHWITMPPAHVEGLVTFQLAPECSGTSYIRSSAGFTTRVEYSGKGWLKGQSHSFVATVCRDGPQKQEKKDGKDKDNKDHPLYLVEGRWSDGYTVRDGRRGGGGAVLETVDLGRLRRAPLQVAPVERQHPLESRRVWRDVAGAIRANDIFAVGHAKGRIENAQRALRRQERAEGREWERRYFRAAGRDPVADGLAVRPKSGGGGGSSRREEDNGGHSMCWKFDHENFRRIEEGAKAGVKSPTHARFDSGVGFLEDEA